MDYLPIFMNIKGHSCFVGGGGEEIEILSSIIIGRAVALRQKLSWFKP